MLVKICGVTCCSTVDFLVEHNVHMVGFVHYERSPRHLDIFQLAQMVSYTRKKYGQDIQIVVVVANPHHYTLNTICSLDVDYIQLHGNEPVAVAERVLSTGKKIIRSVVVNDDFSVEGLPEADYVLFDSNGSDSRNKPPFDWGVLNDLDRPYILAGGINKDNVGTIMELNNPPYIIDVSSGVESNIGIKDHKMILELLTLVNK